MKTRLVEHIWIVKLLLVFMVLLLLTDVTIVTNAF